MAKTTAIAKTAKKAKGTETGSYGDPRYPYCTTPNSLRKFLAMAPEKPKPTKITIDTLKVWGLKNSNDYTILRVLKAIDLLSQSGEPTAHYANFMKRESGPSALGRQIRHAYDDLFQNISFPEKATNEELKNFFNIHSGGGERTIQYQIDTFKALASYATFGSLDPLEQPSPEELPEGPGKPRIHSEPAIRIDLHIHLPEDKSKAEYDAIIESIANHLYKQGREQ